MKYFKIITVTFLMVTLAMVMYGEHSDEFLLGAYSGLRCHYEGSNDPDYNSNFNNELSSLLEQAGFNSVRATAVYNPDPTLVTALASTLNDHNLDLIDPGRPYLRPGGSIWLFSPIHGSESEIRGRV